MTDKNRSIKAQGNSRARKHPADLSFTVLTRRFYDEEMKGLNWAFPMDMQEFMQKKERHAGNLPRLEGTERWVYCLSGVRP